MRPDAADARRSATGERAEDHTTKAAVTARSAASLAVALLAVAVAGAATAGVLGTVGPYLLGVSALVLALFGLFALVSSRVGSDR